MSRLQVIGVSKSFDKQKVLDHVSLEVPDQAIYGLLGPNGAGKTTLIRIINLISMADEGQVLLNGNPITQKDILKIGYLPEERGLYKKMKVGEQALYLAQLKGVPAAEARKKLKFWFEKFEIGSWWNKKVEELSKGMQQKVQFIVTILHEPKLLIFDEPFSGFDPINVNLLKDEILNLRSQGATIIFSTHNMASVEELCDEIALIHQGKKILSGPLYVIKQQFKSHVFELGYPATKVLTLDESHFERVTSLEKNGIRYDQIRILDGNRFAPNQLLQSALPQVEVSSFREILPSLNEIFIQEVNR